MRNDNALHRRAQRLETETPAERWERVTAEHLRSYVRGLCRVLTRAETDLDERVRAARRIG